MTLEMTVKLHDYHELQERSSNSLKIWKGWHITFYILAAICGLLNYSVFQSTAQLFDDNCILYPRKLAFHVVRLPENSTFRDFNKTNEINDNESKEEFNRTAQLTTEESVSTSGHDSSENKNVSDKIGTRRKRESHDNDIIINDINVFNDSTIDNKTHRQVLFTARTLFAMDNECQFAMFMPVLSTAFALVWATFFIMCPGGGLSRSGLRQPWRILAPALLFAIVMLGLTARCFANTNGGLQAFCAAFSNVTNTTDCSAIDHYVESSWGLRWGVGARILAIKGFGTATWVLWGLAAALLLARCLAAPDFVVRRVGVFVTSDPKHKITPYLRKPVRKNNSQRTNTSHEISPNDNVSIKSVPTLSTELVTATGIRSMDSCSMSSMASPVKHQSHGQRDEMMELVYIPQERELPP